MMKNEDFVALILTHGRPDNVITYNTLRRYGYTGRIVLVLDDLDKTRDQYVAKYGEDDIEIFDKRAIAKTFDECDNFNDMRSIIYARNASFDIAERLGVRYFIQLDDDYDQFAFRFDGDFNYYPPTKMIRNLDAIFDILLDAFKAMPQVSSLAISQGGDWMMGSGSRWANAVKLVPKCMNTFICDTERRFQFIGRINEDVNTYTASASTGLVLRTTNQLSIHQKQTQSNAGGMTDIYLASGTYVKSFYTVIVHPSGAHIQMMPGSKKRLHHRVTWHNTAPKLLREDVRKRSAW